LIIKIYLGPRFNKKSLLGILGWALDCVGCHIEIKWISIRDWSFSSSWGAPLESLGTILLGCSRGYTSGSSSRTTWCREVEVSRSVVAFPAWELVKKLNIVLNVFTEPDRVSFPHSISYSFELDFFFFVSEFLKNWLDLMYLPYQDF